MDKEEIKKVFSIVPPIIFYPKTMFVMAMYERYESKKNYDSLHQEYLQLEKTLERYKERAIKLQRIENIRQKKKERRKRRKAKGPRK